MTAAGSADRPGPTGGEPPVRLHLLVEPGANRRLLLELLGPDYEIVDVPSEGDLPERFDLCVVDRRNFRRHREALAERKRQADPEFLPILLITADRDPLLNDATLWEAVDDLVEVPVGRAELAARVENLSKRRLTSVQLAERERALAVANAELERKEYAMDAAPVGVTLTDPDRPDNPVVYANAAFERITGYDRDAAIGRNMRFLQGPETDEAAVETLAEAVERRDSAAVTLINYRRDGSRFWNRVEIAPVHDEAGALIAYVGFQTDVTDQQIRAQRLSVLNRVMRHNLSNDLNVIEGHAANLAGELTDEDHLTALSRIQAAAKKLEQLGDTASWIERVLRRCREEEVPVDVARSVDRVREDVESRYPGADVDLDVRGGPWTVRGSCIEEAIGELVENAVAHNPAETPAVRVRLEPDPNDADRLALTVADDGPGIPERTVEVLRRGEETQLNHGDGLGLWLVYWVVTVLGGSIRVDAPGSLGGTDVTVTLPTGEVADR